MRLTLEVSVKMNAGMPSMVLTATKDNAQTVQIPYSPEMSLAEIFKRFDGMATEPQGITRGDILKTKQLLKSNDDIEEPQEIPQPERIIFDPVDESEIQREDLVKVTNVLPRFKDQSGTELNDPGIVNGGIYRVYKVGQNTLAMPDPDNLDAPAKMTKVVNYYELIDDKSPNPRILQAFPSEVILHKKREKKRSIVKNVISALLKCTECQTELGLVLTGDKYKGPCHNCGHANEIERRIVFCENYTCKDSQGNKSKVEIFLYDGSYQGSCGNCKVGITKKKV